VATSIVGIAEAAQRLGRPVATLYDWRYKGVGPRSAKIGGKVMYREADLEAWIEAAFAEGRGETTMTSELVETAATG